MTIVVRLFAAARELAGRSEVEVNVAEGATVADLRRALVGQCGSLAALADRSLVSINAEYAAEDLPLAPGDEAALIPPVSGG
jgi:molybdopterin converting factor subunit 1